MRASASIRRLKTRARFTLSAGALGLGGRGLFFEKQRNRGEEGKRDGRDGQFFKRRQGCGTNLEEKSKLRKQEIIRLKYCTEETAATVDSA